MSLLWFIAVTALVVILQWPVFAQWLCWAVFAVLAVRQLHPPQALIECYDERVEWHYKNNAELCQLHYLTEYWMVLKIPASSNASLLEKLATRLNRYRLVYRDQMTTTDYRYLRSRLCVDKLLGVPAQKNGS